MANPPSTHSRLTLALLAALGLVTPSCWPLTPAPPQPPAPAAPEERRAEGVPFDVSAVVRQVHFAYRREGQGWSGGHDTYRVQVNPQGLTLTPFHYPFSASFEE